MEQASRILARSNGLSGVLETEPLVCAAWSQAVGKRLARYSRAARMVRERLVVEVDDELWKRSLYGLRSQILRRLEQAVGPGRVTELEFRVMPARFTPQRVSGPTLFDDADHIQDPGLRRIYKQARSREVA